LRTRTIRRYHCSREREMTGLMWVSMSFCLYHPTSPFRCSCYPIRRSRKEWTQILPISCFKKLLNSHIDHLRGLVVRVPGYRSRGLGLVPGTIRFLEEKWVWNRVHWASWVQLRSYLKEKAAAPV
jgi:hypothetical protein